MQVYATYIIHYASIIKNYVTSVKAQVTIAYIIEYSLAEIFPLV